MEGCIAVAAISARVMVESLSEGGVRVIALDLFGDRDTRASALAWHGIGDPARLAFDDEAFMDAVAQLARRGDVAGWVAGSGFEARPDLLARGASVLPLLGNAPELVHRIRTPAWFYPWLATQGVTHAEVSVDHPAPADGWLVKDARACGGWHVRTAGRAAATTSGGGYFQRLVEGVPMSVLFLGDGRDWLALGVARQIVRPLGGHPFIYRGGLGPVALSAAAQSRLNAMLDRVVQGLGLRGLNGIDFILQGDTPVLIELNPRPTASVALFDHRVAGGLMRAHVEVCRGGALSGLVRVDGPPRMHGSEVVFAERGGQTGAATAAWMDAQGWCRDLPAAGTRHAYGDPVCSVIAEGASEDEVEAALASRRREVLGNLEH